MKKCTRCKVEKDNKLFLGKIKNKCYTTCISCRKAATVRNARVRKGEKSEVELLRDKRKIAINNGNFICPTCKLELPLVNFNNCVSTFSCVGNNYSCKKCNKSKSRLSKIKSYGLDKETFIKMFEDQNKSCAICKKSLQVSDTEKMRATTLCIDHDHSTNKVRGLLCNNCNRGLGFLRDNKEILLAAYNYLIVHDKSCELLENLEIDNQQPS